MNAKYFVYVGIIVAAFAMILLIGGSHNATASRSCSTYSTHWECSASVDNYKELYVQDLRYRKGTSGSYHDVTYWEYTSYLLLDTNGIEMPQYGYAWGGETDAMTFAYGGDGMKNVPKASGCSRIELYMLGTISGNAFHWNQTITLCDLSTAALDYAKFNDQIGFNSSPAQNYYSQLAHRSWAQPYSSDNPYSYVYKLSTASATWQEPRNELAFGATYDNQYADPNGVRYNVKMKDYSNTYAVNYTYHVGDSSDKMVYMDVDNSGGTTSGNPTYDISGSDTRTSEQSLWWLNSDSITTTLHDDTLSDNYIYPDRSNWP
jgi:hypothetical protein